MPDPNLDLLTATAEALGPLLDELLLVGGCAAGLLVTDPGVSPIRPTLDVDLVVEARSYAVYHRFSERLRARGFSQGIQPGDPLCRWRSGSLVIDVMPLDEEVLGFSNRWYVEAALRPSVTHLPSGVTIRHIGAPCFLASKLEAFSSRGGGDAVTSSDVEDIVVVVDGRALIGEEVAAAPRAVAGFIQDGIAGLLADRFFVEALPGHFIGEGDVPGRVRILMERLRRLASPDPRST